MGIGGIGIWQLAIILVIVLLLFGTKRLKGLGGDLGGAIKGFKKAMSDEEQNKEDDPKKVNAENAESVDGNTASADAVKAETKKD